MLQIDAIELSLRIRAAQDHHPSETCILAGDYSGERIGRTASRERQPLLSDAVGTFRRVLAQQHSDEHITDRKTHDHCLDFQLQVASSIS